MIGVGVTVGGTGVAVGVGVWLGVREGVEVGVTRVGVAVGVEVSVLLGVGVAVGLSVAVAVGEGVAVGGMREGVGVTVSDKAAANAPVAVATMSVLVGVRVGRVGTRLTSTSRLRQPARSKSKMTIKPMPPISEIISCSRDGVRRPLEESRCVTDFRPAKTRPLPNPIKTRLGLLGKPIAVVC